MALRKSKSTKDLVRGEPEGAQEQNKVIERIKKKERRDKPAQEATYHASMDFLRTKLFYGIVCIVLGLTIALVGVPVLRSQTTDTIDVLCFANDVAAGSVVTSNDVTTVEVSSYHLPTGTVFDASYAVGKYLRVDAMAGDYVTMSRLSPEYPGDDPFLINLPEGKMALSVALSDLSQNVSGKLRSGDVIQIFATDAGSDARVADAPLELQYVEVLTATYRDGVDVSDGDRAGGVKETSKETMSTATLLVNPRQAATITGLERSSTLYAALVIRGNEARKAAALSAQDAYFVMLEEAEAEAERAAAEAAAAEAAALEQSEQLAGEDTATDGSDAQSNGNEEGR